MERTEICAGANLEETLKKALTVLLSLSPQCLRCFCLKDLDAPLFPGVEFLLFLLVHIANWSHVGDVRSRSNSSSTATVELVRVCFCLAAILHPLSQIQEGHSQTG